MPSKTYKYRDNGKDWFFSESEIQKIKESYLETGNMQTVAHRVGISPKLARRIKQEHFLDVSVPMKKEKYKKGRGLSEKHPPKVHQVKLLPVPKPIPKVQERLDMEITEPSSDLGVDMATIRKIRDQYIKTGDLRPVAGKFGLPLKLVRRIKQECFLNLYVPLKSGVIKKAA